jgi:hypothetical protein
MKKINECERVEKERKITFKSIKLVSELLIRNGIMVRGVKIIIKSFRFLLYSLHVELFKSK